jgi:hypothetical protein
VPGDKFDGFALVDLPPGGVWRVTGWPDPFEPPPPPPPISKDEPDTDESRRWDAPNREFRVLYCATQEEGAFGEKLSSFRLEPAVVRAIDEFLVEEADDEFECDDLAGGLTKEDIENLNWQLAWAPRLGGAQAIDITASRSKLAASPGIARFVRAFGFPRLNRVALRTSRRGFTRRVAGYLHEMATDEDGNLQVNGIRYESRLPPAWECWALWEPLPLDMSEAKVEKVTIDHRALRSAAAKLGVPLID